MFSFLKNNNKSLQIYRKNAFITMKKRTLLSATLTVEAALVIPLFLMVIIPVLSTLILFRNQISVRENLINKAHFKALYAYVNWDELENKEFVKVSDTYETGIPYALSPLFPMEETQQIIAHTWIGYVHGLSDELESDRYVYITSDSEVYHMDRDCSYIRLSIHRVTPDELAGSRNEKGAKYQSCRFCRNKKSTGYYYITEDGDHYHTKLGCKGLRRTVYMIPCEEADDRRPCHRCGHET